MYINSIMSIMEMLLATCWSTSTRDPFYMKLSVKVWEDDLTRLHYVANPRGSCFAKPFGEIAAVPRGHSATAGSVTVIPMKNRWTVAIEDEF